MPRGLQEGLHLHGQVRGGEILPRARLGLSGGRAVPEGETVAPVHRSHLWGGHRAPTAGSGPEGAPPTPREEDQAATASESPAASPGPGLAMPVIFDPRMTPRDFAAGTVLLLNRIREALHGPPPDCATARRRIDKAAELYDVLRQTVDHIPKDFVFIGPGMTVTRADLVQRQKIVLETIKNLRRDLRKNCPDLFQYDTGLDG